MGNLSMVVGYAVDNLTIRLDNEKQRSEQLKKNNR